MEEHSSLSTPAGDVQSPAPHPGAHRRAGCQRISGAGTSSPGGRGKGGGGAEWRVETGSGTEGDSRGEGERLVDDRQSDEEAGRTGPGGNPGSSPAGEALVVRGGGGRCEGEGDAAVWRALEEQLVPAGRGRPLATLGVTFSAAWRWSSRPAALGT